MYLSIYSDRETAQRYFPRRTKGPEMWAHSDSWSLPQQTSTPRSYSAHLSSVWRRGGNDCCLHCCPTCLGREVSSCPLCCAGSLWPPTSPQQCRGQSSVGPCAEQKCPQELPSVGCMGCMASHHLGRRAGSTTLLSTPASQPTFCMATCAHQLERKGVLIKHAAA